MVADQTVGTGSVTWRSLLAAGERSVGIATIDHVAYREFTLTCRDSHAGPAQAAPQTVLQPAGRPGGTLGVPTEHPPWLL